MNPRGLMIWVWCLSCLLSPAGLLAQQDFHGADSTFAREGVAILWAVLKGPDEARSWVNIKIALMPGLQANPVPVFSVEAADPFSKETERLVEGQKWDREFVLKHPRSSFQEKTGRRILFYRDAQDCRAQRPAWAVFYLSVPDTAPEFLSEKEMDDYFNQALKRLKAN